MIGGAGTIPPATAMNRPQSHATLPCFGHCLSPCLPQGGCRWIFRLAGLMMLSGFCALLSVSCQSSSAPPAPQVRQPSIGHHWVKVATEPPTFYPVGVAYDSSTDYLSGEWVEIGDEKASRYFIPLHLPGGPPRQELVNEALAMRSERKLREIAKQDSSDNRESLLRFAKYSPVLVPLNAVGMASIAFGNGSYTPIGASDFEGWMARWKREYGDR